MRSTLPRIGYSNAGFQTAPLLKAGGRRRDGSIGDALREMNRPERIVQDHAFYAELPRFGSGDEQPGAALLSAWNTRNVAICARLVQALKPGDRAVVFYGAGHSFLLRQCVSQTPGLKLVEANAYLP